MPINLAIFMFLFCENDNRTPGVFKVFLYHAEFEKNIYKWAVASTYVYSFLRKLKPGLFTSVVTMVTNKISCIGTCFVYIVCRSGIRFRQIYHV